MANLFRKEVESVVSSKMAELSHPVQGYIPRGAIDHVNWVAKKLRIPNPKGGIHPSRNPDSGFLEFNDIPLPKNQRGVIEAIVSLVKDGDRAVTVAFKGGNISFPVIINMLSLIYNAEDRPVENTAERDSAASNGFNTGGAATTGTGANKAMPVPPVNNATEQLVKASQQAVQKVKENFNSLKSGVSDVMNYVFKDRYSTTTAKRP